MSARSFVLPNAQSAVHVEIFNLFRGVFADGNAVGRRATSPCQTGRRGPAEAHPGFRKSARRLRQLGKGLMDWNGGATVAEWKVAHERIDERVGEGCTLRWSVDHRANRTDHQHKTKMGLTTISDAASH
uniref:Uncharacterized protein n=1 Tax=Steinernema glaseri TaxID=37863 RepID=A0A1I7YXV0_9BILA